MSVTVFPATYGTPHFDVADQPERNMSNGNAARVFDVLGIDLDADGWCGSSSADDLLGRVLLAQAIAPSDAGRPATQERHHDGGALFIDCGRAPGYVDEALVDLRAVCEWAKARGVAVSWS